MSIATISAPRGTSDVLGEQARTRSYIQQLAADLLQDAGYQRIETPTFEATQLFARGVGAATDIVSKEMYTFTDGSGRSLTLRPEGTAPVCRAYVQHGLHRRPQPVKLWYASSFYRYERAQKGRYRQFTQIGAEALGSDDPTLDAECIVLMHQLLSTFRCRNLRLRLGSLGSTATRASYTQLLQEHLRAHHASLAPEVADRIELNPLRAFDSQHPGTLAVLATAPRLLDHLQPHDLEHFRTVCALLDAASVPYEVDSTLVRGLDYYQRTVFEFTSDALGAQSGVGGGGRYDGLVQQLGGPPTPGVGWAAGIERILLAGEVQPPQPPPLELYVCVEPPTRGGDVEGTPSGGARVGRGSHHQGVAFELLLAARAARIRAEIELARRSLKGQLNQAHKRRARFAAIVGEGRPLLRDLRDGSEEQLEPQQLLTRVLAARERA
ncbi:MAG: histidine--tRNA ligase [Solirubrobacteraceae bacterium]